MQIILFLVKFFENSFISSFTIFVVSNYKFFSYEGKVLEHIQMNRSYWWQHLAKIDIGLLYILTNKSFSGRNFLTWFFWVGL